MIMGDAVLAVAASADLRAAFGSALVSEPVAVAISEDDVAKDGRIRSLVRRSLVQSVAQYVDARTDGSRRIWEAGPYREHTLDDVRYFLHPAASFRLESINGRTHVALMPEVMVSTSDSSLADREVSKVIRAAVYGYQHNDKFDADLKYWTEKIANVEAPAAGGGTFRIHQVPIYAGLLQKGRPALPRAMQRHVRQQGLVVPDADLLFSSANGKFEVRNPNPLKGLVENKPSDFPVTTSGLSPSVEIGAICPRQDAAKLNRFLNHARHGQSTQFIRQKTTLTPQAARVRWWLSLALYAKALRTPWRLDCLDDETAFVGIGYSLDADAATGSHVLLGCSHLYNSRGEGLQFRLGRIESPIIRGRNPFMSIDDARRTGETIRQLFFDAKMCLPARVVVHKRTPFTEDEQRGLLQGLEGVANVELIKVTIEESLRYMASTMAGGKLGIDRFPVPRGAVVILNESAALLWVHGVTPNAINPNWKYYQGKRRIPTPLLIRRYLGQSDVVQVATEILGLSKMNWNTFDYYSRLPATLDSASAIAKVGTYLSGFGSAPYDYRLLI